MKTTISVIINYDQVSDEHERKALREDMLVVDRKIKAEADITERSWETINESLTNNEVEIDAAIDQFKVMEICSRRSCSKIVTMSDKEIADNYLDILGKHSISTKGKNLGRELMEALIYNPTQTE